LLVSAALMQFGYPSLDCRYYFTRALRASPLILNGPVFSQNFVLTALYDFYGRVHDANTSSMSNDGKLFVRSVVPMAISIYRPFNFPTSSVIFSPLQLHTSSRGSKMPETAANTKTLPQLLLVAGLDELFEKGRIDGGLLGLVS
jgi:hypothetical protein